MNSTFCTNMILENHLGSINTYGVKAAWNHWLDTVGGGAGPWPVEGVRGQRIPEDESPEP